MITRAWTEMTDEGELWIYPVTEDDQTRMEVRAVLKGATVTWSVAPSEAGVLAEMLKAIAERPDPGEASPQPAPVQSVPAEVPVEAPAEAPAEQEPEVRFDYQQNRFVSQEPQEEQSKGISGIGSRISNAFSKLSERDGRTQGREDGQVRLLALSETHMVRGVAARPHRPEMAQGHPSGPCRVRPGLRRRRLRRRAEAVHEGDGGDHGLHLRH